MYSGDPNTGRVRYSSGGDVSGCGMCGFETELDLKIQQSVRFLNGPPNDMTRHPETIYRS